jgi:hypothetical protein
MEINIRGKTVYIFRFFEVFTDFDMFDEPMVHVLKNGEPFMNFRNSGFIWLGKYLKIECCCSDCTENYFPPGLDDEFFNLHTGVVSKKMDKHRRYRKTKKIDLNSLMDVGEVVLKRGGLPRFVRIYILKMAFGYLEEIKFI